MSVPRGGLLIAMAEKLGSDGAEVIRTFASPPSVHSIGTIGDRILEVAALRMRGDGTVLTGSDLGATLDASALAAGAAVRSAAVEGDGVGGQGDQHRAGGRRPG